MELSLNNNWYKFIINCILIFVSSLLCDNNFFMTMLTIDSLFSAFYFLIHFMNFNITEKQLVKNSSNIYTIPIINRYIYYILVFSFYELICFYLWIFNFPILYWIILFSICPNVLNKLFEFKFFDKIKNIKENIIKIIVAKQFAGLINILSLTYLDKNVSVKHKEILPLLENYKDTISYSGDAIKNAFVIILLAYIKKSSPIFYYRVTKYFYTYKTGDMISSYNIISAKRTLIDIVDNKKYDELLKPNIYRAMFHLYQENNSDKDFFGELIINFKFKLIKMFSIWTLSTLSNFPNNIFIAPVLSLLFLIYRSKSIINFFTNKTNINKIILLIFSAIIGWFYDSYFICCFLSQFSYVLLINKITIDIFKFIVKNTKKIFIKYRESNRNYILQLLLSVIYTVIFSTYKCNNSFIIMICCVIYNVVIEKNNKKKLILLFIFLSSILSDFNKFHILFNGILCYFLIPYIDNNPFYIIFSYILKLYNFLLSFFKYYINLVKHNINKFLYPNDIHILENKEVMIQSYSINNIDNDIFSLSSDKFIDAISENNKRKIKISRQQIKIIDDYY